MIIRPAVSTDAPALSLFAARVFHDTFAAQNTADDMTAYLRTAFSDDRQLAEINNPDTVTLVAEEDGTFVGYAQLRRSDPPACVPDRAAIELVRLYVDRRLHGGGVAHRLMEAALAAASSRAPSMWLGVWEHNPRAIAFYLKWGFIDVGSHVFQLGDDPQLDRIMWRAVEGEPEQPSTN